MKISTRLMIELLPTKNKGDALISEMPVTNALETGLK